MNTKPAIVIAGYIVGGPLGGLVWHHLQYVLGLHNMGYEVMFVEDSDDYPSCYNPVTSELCDDPSYGLSFINKVFAAHDLQDKWAYYHRSTDTWYGTDKRTVQSFIQRAEVFLNLSGLNPVGDYFSGIPNRVFVDTDPVFTQIRHLTDTEAFERCSLHNHFFSFGENFGKNGCTIPDDGFKWLPTRQPVYMPAWLPLDGNPAARWTTVMQWDSYKVREYKKQVYGMKSSSFDAYFSLPQLTKESFELAIGNATAPRDKLKSFGWQLTDSLSVTDNPGTYQQFIHASKGEWSVAKHGYVISNSGWFSERTTCYLASARPAVVQDTGFSDFIATGRGIFSFKTPEEAVAAIAAVNSNYKEHCLWAREIAEEYFRFDKVLRHLLNQCAATAAIN